MNFATYYRPSSELHRYAIAELRNEDRLSRWRARYTLATGHEPVICLHPVLTSRQAARIAANRESNQHRQHIPHHRRQRIKGKQPQPPSLA